MSNTNRNAVQSTKEQDSQAVRTQCLLACTAIALAAVALSRWFLLGHAPSDVVATHWNVSGQADSAFTVSGLLWGLSATALAPAAIAIVLLAMRWPLQRQPLLLSGLSAVTTFVGTLTACISWSIAALNEGATRWQDAAPMPGRHVVLVVVLPLLLAAVAAFLARKIWPPSSRAAQLSPSLNLESEERAVWMGRVHAGAWLWIGLPLSAGLAWTVVELTGAFAALLVLGALVILADTFSMLRVIVDREGLSVRYGHLGLFRQLIPLAKVDGARATHIKPLNHGGWGYRGSLLLLGKAAVVVRRGDAIEVTLHEGRLFLVTVDDAATGAALLNGLAQQQFVE